MVGRGVDKEARDRNELTRSHYAAQGDGKATVKLLVNTLGADKDARGKIRETPLHLAASERCVAIVDLPVNLGADKEARDKNGKTPLHYAARGTLKTTVSLFKLLVKRRADEDAEENADEEADE